MTTIRLATKGCPATACPSTNKSRIIYWNHSCGNKAYLDRYAKVHCYSCDCNYKILGLACLLLAAKYVENDPCVPNLPSFIRVYNNIIGYKYIISVTDLFYAEVLACKMLSYKLNYYTIYDFDSFFSGMVLSK